FPDLGTELRCSTVNIVSLTLLTKIGKVSLHAKHLKYGLLQKDPKSRMGSQGGANEIKTHSFFRGVNWALARCMNPPTLDAPLF
ncbi:hypothetical protein HN51_010790, partial [Arachis hypogaea]